MSTAAVEGTDDDKRRAFHRAFVQLSNRINLMLALPVESLERQALIEKLRAIGTAEARNEFAGPDRQCGHRQQRD